MNRAAICWIFGLVSVGAACVVCAAATYATVVRPSIRVPAAIPVQIARSGAVSTSYVASAAREWLFYYYDWSVLNYAERSKIAVRSASPELRADLARFLGDQWEVIDAGQQTQAAVITIADPVVTGGQWSVTFDVVAEPWIGALRAPTRRVSGTLWLSFSGVRPGATSLLQVDALRVTSDEQDAPNTAQGKS